MPKVILAPQLNKTRIFLGDERNDPANKKASHAFDLQQNRNHQGAGQNKKEEEGQETKE